MKKHFFSICSALTLTAFLSTAIAALPPFYQSLRELKAVLNSPLMDEKFGSGAGPIKGIEVTERVHLDHQDTGYVVRTHDCELTVFVHYRPMPGGVVGPGVFDLIPGAHLCREHNN